MKKLAVDEAKTRAIEKGPNILAGAIPGFLLGAIGGALIIRS